MRKALVVVALLCVTGCRASRPASPSSVLDGSWTGSIGADGGSSGQIVLTLRQTGPGVSGEWTGRSGDAWLNRAGVVSGSVTLPTVSLFLTPQVGINCGGLTLSGTLGLTATIDGDHLVGRYVALTCDSATGGTIDVTRTGG